MAGLIKSSDVSGVRDFLTREPASAVPEHPSLSPTPDPTIARLEAEVERLQALLHTRDAQIQSLERGIDTARLQGEEEGRRIALDEIDHSRTEALERLEIGLARALEQFGQQLLSLEHLAVLIARTAVDKLVTGGEHYHEICKAAISSQLARLDATSIVEVAVPRADFPDEAELAELVDTCGVDQGRIIQTGALQTGECRIRLTLGEMEVGIGQQWSRLAVMFSDTDDQEVC